MISLLLDDVSLVLLNDDLDAILTAVIGVRADRVPAFDDAVLYMGIIADINVVEYDGILDVAVGADEDFLEYDGVFYCAVDDAAG